MLQPRWPKSFTDQKRNDYDDDDNYNYIFIALMMSTATKTKSFFGKKNITSGHFLFIYSDAIFKLQTFVFIYQIFCFVRRHNMNIL